MTHQEFSSQCTELANKIINIVFQYPKEIGICVLPGVMASVCLTHNIPHEKFLEVFEAAIDDMIEKGLK